MHMDDKLKGFYEVALSRRSVRKYETKPVPIPVLERIIEAGLWAPSALNTQPWFLHVLTGKKRDEFAVICRVIWDKLKPVIEKRYGPEGVKLRESFYHNLGDAPAAIVIYADNDDSDDGWTLVSCAMAAENIMLAATAEGLGSLYMAAQLTIREQIDAFFDEDRKLVGCVLLGYSADEPKAWPRREVRVDWGDSWNTDKSHDTH